jgi:hypothetical protein
MKTETESEKRNKKRRKKENVRKPPSEGWDREACWNQVSLHATKRILGRFSRDDSKHLGISGDEVEEHGIKRREKWEGEKEVRARVRRPGRSTRQSWKQQRTFTALRNHGFNSGKVFYAFIGNSSCS